MSRWAKESLKDRLERNYIPEPNSGCWLWLASENPRGYGQVWDIDEGRAIVAHRASYKVFVGPIPEGARVLHKCDTPLCINPDHLFLGTQQDNLLDMATKGRGRKSKKGLPSGIVERKMVGDPIYYAIVSIRGKRVRSKSFHTIEPAIQERDRLRALGRKSLAEGGA